MGAPVWPEPASPLSRERAARARVAFFDIDGTLVPLGTETMPASTARALDRLRERGVKLVIITGRHLDYAREVERFHPFDGWLCANGSYCLLDGEVVRAHPLDATDVRTAVAEAAAGGYAIALTYARDLAVGLPGGDRSLIGATWDHSPVMDYAELDLSRPVYQLNAVVGPERDAELLAHTPHLKSARWTDRFMDIVPADGGKQAGMAAVLAVLGAPREHCLAFGDGGNDRDMIAFAGVGVAMGNASPEVKAVASYVTSPCDEDGVAHALEALAIG